jgi:tetratricopeptide (TPR) repeat protein
MREAAQHPNEFRQQAQLALASLGPSSSGEAPKNFDEAFAAGKTAVDLWNSANVAAKIAKENNSEEAETLQEQAKAKRAEAKRMLETAIALAAPETPLEQLNAARYYLAILYWEDRQLHEAAVLSEFLATRYPENEYAPTAAKVALAAYEALAIEAKSANNNTDGADLSYEATKLAQLAELVATRWPQSAEASSAVNALIQTALRENRLADAEALINKLPVEARGAAQLSLGAGLWTQYLRSTVGSRDNPGEAAIALRNKAGQLLSEGFQPIRETGNPNKTSAVGALYLAQFLLANGDAEQAISVLEDKQAGPLTLVESGAAVAKEPGFTPETYKAALRAYLSAATPNRKEAERMMESLEKFVAADGDAKKLTKVYLGLGVQLQRQLKELNAAGQTDKAKHVAEAFGDVLARVSARSDANDWQVRGWIAQTNLQLGQELSAEEAKPYIDRATEAYQAMLKAADENPKYAPGEADKLGVRMRLAECLAATGDHEGAVKQFGMILAEKPNMLDLQKGAATALQQWGMKKKDLSAFNRSIQGDLPQKDGRNLIWGWLKLATMANSAHAQAARVSPVTEESRLRANRFKELFFEARYNVAKSRFLAGKAATADQRRAQFEAAKTNIEQMAKLYPDLGGPNWKPLFDELLKQTNLELKKK